MDPNFHFFSKKALRDQHRTFLLPAKSRVKTAESIAAKAICTGIAFFVIRILSSFLCRYHAKVSLIVLLRKRKQEKFYNSATSSLSGPSVALGMSKMAAQTVGNSVSEFLSGFSDGKTDSAARVSFKYGCTRGVFGAPFFFVNGFLQPGGGSPIDYSTWIGILDPLVSQNGERIEMFTSM